MTLLMTIEKQTFRKGYCEFHRLLATHKNKYRLSILYGFYQDGQLPL